MGWKHMANQIVNSDPGDTRLKQQLHKNVKINFASVSKSTDVKEKEKKRKAIVKRFALHANVKKRKRKTVAKLFALHANTIR